ncbi:MAG: dUTP diphosphatase [bacterium]|nr:dUTP diphosphatase [bacterium]
MKVKIFTESRAPVPVYMTEGASGADLFAFEDTVIKPKEAVLVRTGVRIEIEDGYECQVRPRSGYSMKNKILILNSPGTIDSDYRGEIKVIMYNLSDESFSVKKNDRIAQMVFAEVIKAEFISEKLEESARGEGGFGHTGGM